MGEPISVISINSGVSDETIFETNRNFTGMGHEQYIKEVPITGDRPVDRLAQLLFDKGSVKQVHIYAQSISIIGAFGFDAEIAKSLIEDFYIHYKPGVPVPDESSFS